MGWQDRNVYFRDFAYTAKRRARMATGNISEVPANDFAELLSGPMLDVYVGANRRHWSLHRNLFLHHSERLENELHGSDGKKLHALELIDHDPSGFELLVKWLYQGRLDDVSDMADANQKYEYAVDCHRLYLLCDRFDMPQLKNVAMDQYRKGLNEAELVPDADEIDEIYRKSPDGSPFRRLMTRIAARQIMDPSNDRDVETYRSCFEQNPDFAVDLVKAIKHGAGGILFADPTDDGNACEYHDHEAGPNCHIKGKRKSKQAIKDSIRARADPRRDPKYAKSKVSANSVLPLRPRPPTPPQHSPLPAPQQPAHLARQARRQDSISAGPLRRRLTSPASSTVETSTETATAEPQSPKEQRNKSRRVSPSELRQASPESLLEETTESRQAPVVRHQSSDDTPHLTQDNLDARSDTGTASNASQKAEEQITPPRGIWQWAKAGTGRLGIIGRLPHPEWKGPIPIMTSKAANSAVNGALEGERVGDSLDDFSILSSIATEPLNEEAEASMAEGLGITNMVTGDSLFSQTKRSSDDLVAVMNGTPSPKVLRDQWTTGDDEGVSVSLPLSKGSPPASPSPIQRKKQFPTNGTQDTPRLHRIPKYKIALNSNILLPSRKASSIQ